MVGRLERNKDLLQEAVENTAQRVGSIASIISTAVADVAREIGELVTDGFEMRDAARAARAAEIEQQQLTVGDPVELEKLHGNDAEDDAGSDDADDDEQY